MGLFGLFWVIFRVILGHFSSSPAPFGTFWGFGGGNLGDILGFWGGNWFFFEAYSVFLGVIFGVLGGEILGFTFGAVLGPLSDFYAFGER